MKIDECFRDDIFGKALRGNAQALPTEQIPGQPHLRQDNKWKLYSDLFILLKE